MKIGAEVVPQPGKTEEAKKALQNLGFQILHAGKTSVSVAGLEAVWKNAFATTSNPVRVPAALKELIASVSIAERPQFFQ